MHQLNSEKLTVNGQGKAPRTYWIFIRLRKNLSTDMVRRHTLTGSLLNSEKTCQRTGFYVCGKLLWCVATCVVRHHTRSGSLLNSEKKPVNGQGKAPHTY